MKKDKLVIGYGLKFSSESFDYAWKVYKWGALFSSKKAAREQIKEYRKNGHIDEGETVTIFQVTAELL